MSSERRGSTRTLLDKTKHDHIRRLPIQSKAELSSRIETQVVDTLFLWSVDSLGATTRKFRLDNLHLLSHLSALRQSILENHCRYDIPFEKITSELAQRKPDITLDQVMNHYYESMIRLGLLCGFVSWDEVERNVPSRRQGTASPSSPKV